MILTEVKTKSIEIVGIGRCDVLINSLLAKSIQNGMQLHKPQYTSERECVCGL